MFSKTAKDPAKPAPDNNLPIAPEPAPPNVQQSAAASAQARKPKVATLIAEHMTIEGGVIGDGELHVDGVVRGDVKVGKLTIGETGHVEGSIIAESVENRGKIVGTVTAKQVRLYGTAHVDGDVTHEQLAMEIGAFFQGRSLKFQRPAVQPAVISAPPPAKVEPEIKAGLEPPMNGPRPAPPQGPRPA